MAGADSQATGTAVDVTSARSAVAKTIKIKTPAPLRLPFQNNQNKDSRPFTPSPAGLLLRRVKTGTSFYVTWRLAGLLVRSSSILSRG